MTDEARRYCVWDYDAGMMIKYERTGQCNLCGRCCRSLIEIGYIKPGYDGSGRNGGAATSGRGTWYEVEDRGRRHFWQVDIHAGEARRCPHLSSDDHCVLHGAPDEAAICRLWPFSPECVTAFPGCSFGFREMGRWRLVTLEDGTIDVQGKAE